MESKEKILSQIKELLGERGLLRLSNDLVFKAYFARNRDVLISLLSNFLPLPPNSTIVDATVSNPELLSDKLPDISGASGKTLYLDIKVKFSRENSQGDKKTENANVEIQTSMEPHFTDRLLLYLSRMYSEQLKRGEKHKRLAPVYGLAFTTVNLKQFKEIKDEYLHICRIQRDKSPLRNLESSTMTKHIFSVKIA